MTPELRNKLRVHPIRRIMSASVGIALVPLTLYVGLPDRNGGAVAVAIGLFFMCTVRILRPFPLVPPFGTGAIERSRALQAHLDQVTVGPPALYRQLEQFGLLFTTVGAVLNAARYF